MRPVSSSVCRTVSSSRSTSRSARSQLHSLTAHEQYKPIEIGPTVDENGVERKVSRLTKLRAKLSKGYYGEQHQIEKPTVEEYKEITSGHGHH